MDGDQYCRVQQVCVSNPNGLDWRRIERVINKTVFDLAVLAQFRDKENTVIKKNEQRFFQE